MTEIVLCNIDNHIGRRGYKYSLASIKSTKMGMKQTNLPEPTPFKAGRGWAIFFACVALACMGAAIWWLLREPYEKENLRNGIAEVINEKFERTPLSGLGDMFKSPPLSLPGKVVTPPTEEGTLSGQIIEATVGDPVEMAGEGRVASGTPELILSSAGVQASVREVPDFSSVPLPRVTEDSRIPPDYLQLMAQWLVKNYRAHSGGGLALSSVQALNSMLGDTVGQNTAGGRLSVLRYVFQPSMIEGLYNIYIDRFIESVKLEASKKGLDLKARQKMGNDLANWANEIASGMEGVITMENLSAQLDNIEKLAQNTINLNASLAASIYELDEIRNRKKGAMELEAAQLRVEGLTARFRRAEEEHRLAKKNLAKRIRKVGGNSLDDDSLLFLCYWARRRMGENANALVTLRGAVALMRDLSRRFAETGTYEFETQ